MSNSSLQTLPRRKPDESDRRRSIRVPHVVEAWLSSPTDFTKAEQLEVRAVNLSRHGVAFDTDHEVPTGSFWVMEIGMGEQRMLSEVRIISCRKTDHGVFEVGGEFC